MADKEYFIYSDSFMFCSRILRDLSENATYGTHFHNVFELIYVKSGEGFYCAENEKYPFKANDLLITRPYESHEMHLNSEVPYERYALLLDEGLLGFPFSEKLEGRLPPISFKGNSTLHRILEKFDFYFETLTGDELRIILNGLSREICSNILLTLGDLPTPKTTENRIVLDALSYIDSNLMNIESIEEISSAIFITKSHLHHMFSRHLGKSPKKYITEKRLTLAQREISQGAKPSEVYARYGFSEYSSFFRSYKKMFGKPPSANTSIGRTAVTPESTTVRTQKS